MQSLHETHKYSIATALTKSPRATFCTESLKQVLPSHSSKKSCSSCTYPRLSLARSLFSRPGTSPDPGKLLGLLVLPPLGFAVGLRRRKRITTDRFTSSFHLPNFLIDRNFLVFFQIRTINLLEINKIFSISLGKNKNQ